MSDTVLKKIADKLKIRFPVAEFSRELGYSKGAISEYLNGKKELSENFKELLKNKYSLNDSDFIINEIHILNEPPKKYKSEGKVISDDDYPEKSVLIIPIKGRGGLENAMEAKGMKPSQLAIKIGASPSTITRFFALEFCIRFDYILKIVNALELNIFFETSEESAEINKWFEDAMEELGRHQINCLKTKTLEHQLSS